MIMLPNKTSEVVRQRALQRIGTRRFWYYNLIGFGRRALAAPVAELGRLIRRVRAVKE